MLISGISYKWASYVVIGLPTLLLEMLIVYKIGNLVFGGSKIALTAVLLTTVSDNVLDMVGKNIIPNSIGVAVVFLIFYLFLRNSSSKLKVLIMLLTIGLVFTHILSLAFMIFQTTIIFVVFLLYQQRKERKKISYIFLTAFMFILGILCWKFIPRIYFIEFMILIKEALGGFSLQKYFSSLTVPFTTILLARLGMMIYVGLAGVGILYYFKKSYKPTENQLILLLTSAFFTGFGTATFLIWPGIAHRFWYYGEILGSFFVAYLLISFYNSKKHSVVKKIFTVGLVFVLAYLMFVASISNDDNPIVPEYTIRNGW